MKKKEARILFNKYVNNQCSPKELQLMNAFLDSYQKDKEVWLGRDFDEATKKKLWSKIQSSVKQSKKSKLSSFVPFLKYAAVLIGIIISGFLWQTRYNQEVVLPIASDNAVILKIENNILKELNTAEEHVLKNTKGNIIAHQKKNTITYKPNELIESLTYNELLVPKGKMFQLILSDGTVVHLNAESSIKFPVNFSNDQERVVYLSGEAYFEVTQDTTRPFKVVSRAMEIRVLGTHFNVSSYDKSMPYTVLVEGSITVHSNELGKNQTPECLEPGQKAAFSMGGAIAISNVSVQDYIGWRKGTLVLNNETFKEIIQKIERRDNIIITNLFHELDTIRFNGEFQQNETIVDIMKTFKESFPFEYTIVENKVIISKPKNKNI